MWASFLQPKPKIRKEVECFGGKLFAPTVVWCVFPLLIIFSLGIASSAESAKTLCTEKVEHSCFFLSFWGWSLTEKNKLKIMQLHPIIHHATVKEIFWAAKEIVSSDVSDESISHHVTELFLEMCAFILLLQLLDRGEPRRPIRSHRWDWKLDWHDWSTCPRGEEQSLCAVWVWMRGY